MSSHSNTEDQASPGLWSAAVIGYIVHVILGLSTASAGKDPGVQIGGFIGTMLGAFLWPLLFVWIASFRRNNTERRRVKVFFIATMVFVLLRFVGMAAFWVVRG